MPPVPSKSGRGRDGGECERERNAKSWASCRGRGAGDDQRKQDVTKRGVPDSVLLVPVELDRGRDEERERDTTSRGS